MVITLIKKMHSTSPFILRHFIPFQFSKQAVDRPNNFLKKQPFVPKEDNPLQNIKLKALEHAKDPKFQLTFTNRTTQKYKPKCPIRSRRLLELIWQQKQEMRTMARESQQPETERFSSKHTFDRVKQVTTVKKQEKLSIPSTSIHHRNNTLDLNSAKRSKTCNKRPDNPELLEDESEPFQQEGCHLQNIRTSSMGRLWRTSHQLHRHSDSTTQNTHRPLKVKGSRAPSSEVVDHLRRTSLNSFRKVWF